MGYAPIYHPNVGICGEGTTNRMWDYPLEQSSNDFADFLPIFTIELAQDINPQSFIRWYTSLKVDDGAGGPAGTMEMQIFKNGVIWDSCTVIAHDSEVYATYNRNIVFGPNRIGDIIQIKWRNMNAGQWMYCKDSYFLGYYTPFVT